MHLLSFVWLCGGFISLVINMKMSQAFQASRSVSSTREPAQISKFLRTDNQYDLTKMYSTLLYRNGAGASASVCPASCQCSKRSDDTVDVVDCSSRGLRTIPDLPVTAREIYLQNNEIRDIPQGHFRHLSSLKTLDFSKNVLRKVPNGTFQGLSSLVFLSLQGNQLSYLPGTFEPGAFHGLLSLECLHLEGNQPNLIASLSYPDQALAHVPTLRQLWLDGYPRTLGLGFSSLVHLSRISFITDSIGAAYCSMGSDIPENFFSNIATDQPLSIDLADCEISFIPAGTFKSVPTLYSLNLNHNQDLSMDGFETASKGLQNSNLTVLQINNIVEPFPTGSAIRNTTFQYLKNTTLKILLVEACKLGFIDSQAILDLPKTVEFISFSDNFIRENLWLYTLSHLTNLRIWKGSDQGTAGVRKTKPLHFDLALEDSSGRVETLKSTQGRDHTSQMSTTYRNFKRTLNLSGVFQNKERTIVGREHLGNTGAKKEPYKSLIYPLPRRLEIVYARDCFPRHPIRFPFLAYVINNDVLQYVDISFNDIIYIDGILFGLPSLRYLDVSENGCEYINPLLFSHTNNLTTLLLYKNRLGKCLADDTEGIIFSPLPLLTTLDLHYNELTDLSEWLVHSNSDLRVLNLSHNALSQFQPNLVNNKKLQVLDLSFNQLEGFSESNCRQLLEIKKSNSKFITNVNENNFLCNCKNLYFLQFLLDNPELFVDIDTFYCRAADGQLVRYARLAQLIPRLDRQCTDQSIFTGVLVAFFLLTSTLAICGLYYYKRWQWKYLFYVGKSRLQIGSMHLTYRPLAHSFITYDQEHTVLRGAMRLVFLPRLHEMGITTILGEVDFQGGPLAPSIAGAVTSTGKTVVFLSRNIFEDYYRRLEMNLAIMHELHLGRPILVPVLLLGDDTMNVERDQAGGNVQPVTRTTECGDVGPRLGRPRGPYRDPHTRFNRLLRDFPPEIATFLKGQIHRCIVYPGDHQEFWQLLRNVILEE